MTIHEMPTLFIAHSGPPLALDSVAGEDYRNLGKALPVPEAVLIFSAHWEADPLTFGETSTHNRLVYDFSGFQPELYQLQYPAPGASWLVDRIATLLNIGDSVESTDRGLDHGIWVPFLHIWPKADVPILQMSMPRNMTDKDLFELGRLLRPLRRERILIVGSGSLTHNLRRLDWRHQGPAISWAVEFDQWVEQTLIQHDYDALLTWQTRAPQAQMNHPTPEHFRPLLIAAGAAQNDSVSFPILGFELGSLSRRSVLFQAKTGE